MQGDNQLLLEEENDSAPKIQGNIRHSASPSSSGHLMQGDIQLLLEDEEENASATKIQKVFRGRTDVQLKRLEVRENFCSTFAGFHQNINWKIYGVDSDFIRQLLFFFDAKKDQDIDILCQVCDLLLEYVKRDVGDVVNLFSGVNCSQVDVVNLFSGVKRSQVEPVVIYRVKRLALLCVHTLHENRFDWVRQAVASSESKPMPFVKLLETLVCILNPILPWNCKLVEYLQQQQVYCLFRGVIIAVLQSEECLEHFAHSSALNKVLIFVASHGVNHPCRCPIVDPRWSFSSQLLSIPFLWKHLPDLKEVFSADGFSTKYIHQITCFVQSSDSVLPNDALPNHPGHACVLANVLESAALIFSGPDFTFDRAAETIAVCTSLLDAFSKVAPLERTYVDINKPTDVEITGCLHVDLQRHIMTGVQQLVNAIFTGTLSTSIEPLSIEMRSVISICDFLHVILNTNFVNETMTMLIYSTEIASALWNVIRSWHKSKKLQSSHKCLGDTFDWLRLLSIFCPMYSHVLRFMDIEEFKKQEKPFSPEDLSLLIFILKEALWGLIPPQTSSVRNKTMSIENLKCSARIGICELLTQLEDLNNLDQFVPDSDFSYEDYLDADFASQATIVGTRESEIIRLAPFLVPFNTRLNIFHLHLTADHLRMAQFRQPLVPHQIEIRRTRLLEDAFDKLNFLSSDDLKGMIRVSFLNDHGMEEIGIDGGGIFRDFMHSVTKEAFDKDAGLFKGAADHLLYPDPESRFDAVKLQYFYVVGVLLGKAMYEKIPIDVSFAIFFLRKLKQKSTCFNDLFSLNPIYYRSVVESKKSDEFEKYLYFLAPDGKELLPGGRNMHVTKNNIISYMHLIADYLNNQTREQAAQFLSGFQQVIPKVWTDMFSERELQVVISGPARFDVDDLRLNTNYGGEYHDDHEVIKLFWKVLEDFDLPNLRQFLMFVTGCSRSPVAGFQALDPHFGIMSDGVHGGDPNWLPTASTCINQLRLPSYLSEEQMKMKLLMAITSKASFDLE